MTSKRKMACLRCGHDIFWIVEQIKGRKANIIKLECEICKRIIQFKTPENIYF